ncbi:FtsB family cell division protein [Cellulomonas gilvus]|uniref:FtsB family cell division protein n=1 Tax=Cellulomonas gilvus TaxID=11 RepID=UPI00145F9A28|nr:septum formation initiator family protein [Cellulomonas gilvus]
MQTKVPRLFSVRAIVLGVVLVLAFVLVYPTLHTYLRQQVELRGLRQDVAAARERNDDLEAELARWDDPAYITAQARERLAYVFPGETAFRVVDPESVEEPAAPVDEQDTPVATTTAEVPWYSALWDSMAVAGAEPTTDDATTPEKDSRTGTDDGAGAKKGTDAP